jgi:hypothetical protein
MDRQVLITPLIVQALGAGSLGYAWLDHRDAERGAHVSVGARGQAVERN